MSDLLGWGAVFSVGAYMGGLVGAAAGLVCGWGAGRTARAVSARKAKRAYLRSRNQSGPHMTVVINNPAPDGGQVELDRSWPPPVRPAPYDTWPVPR